MVPTLTWGLVRANTSLAILAPYLSSYVCRTSERAKEQSTRQLSGRETASDWLTTELSD